MNRHGLNIPPALLLILLWIANGASQASAQSARREQMEIYLHYACRETYRSIQHQGDNIDFLNYLDYKTDTGCTGVVHVGFSLSPSEKWVFSADLGMMSDMRFSQMNISASRIIGKTGSNAAWGLSAGISAYPVYLNEFNEYHLLRDTGLIADLNVNYRQQILYDPGLELIPFLNYKKNKLSLKAGTGLRISTFLPFNQLIMQKKEGGNFRREIRYETLFKPALSSVSALHATLMLTDKPGLSVGLQASAQVLFGMRTIPYKRSILTWTADNRVTDEIKPGSKPFTVTEVSAGIVFRF
ncbi:hypothetical protein TBC1_121057 [Lentimicrobium saccharophilum]|uniref:Outer membrane protein beta-barrel domain n=1 Tax=Lentimicrobium saccharophilum TaxID=1678841 RepID=A0A0S7C5S3_9BACT|nr:hypothetical protein [Lentimicrobium saccharophilum]GAP45236.1 hypothetical protein TBC1_121057 [Lentimicrobium saccharophilum]